MRYLMRQKSFSLGDKFRIRDDAGRDVFVVNGKVLSLGDKLSFQDTEGRELAFIREKLISMTPTYEIHRDG